MHKLTLERLAQLLDKQGLVNHEEGDYARYEDEKHPDAGVVLCRKDGTVIIWMPTIVWSELRTYENP